MRRKRENPCTVCGHYHGYEQGEACGVCGHRPAASERVTPPQQAASALPSEILGEFLYLGSYDNASRGEILKALGISRILNTVPTSQNLYKNSFNYHCLQDDKTLQFGDAIQFLEQCEKDKTRVLVHCMFGKNRSPAVVIAYLMKCKGWSLAQGLHWVKERRPLVELSPAVYQQLLDYEQKIFGSSEPCELQTPSKDALPSFGFGLHKTTDAAPLPTSHRPASTSILEHARPGISSDKFVFGAGTTSSKQVAGAGTFGINAITGTEAPMESG